MKVDITIRVADPEDNEAYAEIVVHSADADKAHKPEWAAKALLTVLDMYLDEIDLGPLRLQG